MGIVFDAHNHCFQPLGEAYPDEDMADRLREHQYHLRFHAQGIRRLRDNARVDEPLLVGDGDGISWLPEVNFRISAHGRVEFTVDGEDYYIQWMPPGLWDMSCPAAYTVAQMDYVGVDKALLQADHLYGRLDQFHADCVREYPDRLAALGQVEEWRGGEPDQLEWVRHQIEDLGLCGIYFGTQGFYRTDFRMGLNDPSLEPLWNLLAELGVPVFWYVTNMRQPRLAAYLHQVRELTAWARAHPHIPSVLTHGISSINIDRGLARFTVPADVIELLQCPNLHVELMLHLMNSDADFPYEWMPDVVRFLIGHVGYEKLMWGSDMPACERTVTYRQSLRVYQTQCEFLTTQQRDAILGANLERLLRGGQ